MPIFLPDEPEFETVEKRHSWFEAVLLAEFGEQEGMADEDDIPAELNWLFQIPSARRYDIETAECSMVYQSPSGDYACSIWDATGEDDEPWAVFVVDDAGARFLHEYSVMEPDTGDAGRDAVLQAAQNEIPDRAEAGEWNRTSPALAIPDALREPRPKEINE